MNRELRRIITVDDDVSFNILAKKKNIDQHIIRILYMAMGFHSIRIMKILTEYMNENDAFPLFIASMNKEFGLEYIQILLEKINVNACNLNKSLIHVVCWDLRISTLYYLLSRDDLDIQTPDSDGRTPLQIMQLHSFTTLPTSSSTSGNDATLSSDATKKEDIDSIIENMKKIIAKNQIIVEII